MNDMETQKNKFEEMNAKINVIREIIANQQKSYNVMKDLADQIRILLPIGGMELKDAS